MLEPRPEAVPDDDPIRRVHEHAFAPSPEEAGLADTFAYYPRFGFQPGPAFGVVEPFGVPPEARGRVSYAEALSIGG